MVQGYYTLQEAAEYLDLSQDELKQMAKTGKIRSFQDRGNLRFRIQDVQEMARARGSASEPDQVLGDASLPPPRSSSTPPSGSKKPAPSHKTPTRQDSPEVLDFDFDSDKVELGIGVTAPGSGAKSKPPGARSDRKPGAATGGSDSDVRLVHDGTEVTFSIPKKDPEAKRVDSDVVVPPASTKVKTAPAPASSSKRSSQLAIESDRQKKPPGAASPSSKGRQTSPRPGTPPQAPDSGVRLVPPDDDSDVKLLGSSDDVPLGQSTPPAEGDSDVRLEKVELPAESGEGDMMLTEEINLDDEIRKYELDSQEIPATKLKRKSEVRLPEHSPFELSDSDLEMPRADSGPATPAQPHDPQDDSDDFELTPQKPASPGVDSKDFDIAPPPSGRVVVEGDSNDFSLEVSESDDQVLDEPQTELTSSTSGISLDNPVDAGISLEDNQESEDFDMSLEVDDTPQPTPGSPVSDSDGDFEVRAETHKTKLGAKKPGAPDNEFELTLDADSAAPALETDDDSAFELNLEGSNEGEMGATADADSEFELALDESGEVATSDDEPAPQVKSKTTRVGPQQDIFETDFEVPALDESDDATAADSELESSDFDLALDDSELAQEEESGSQVVALDEEEGATDAEGEAAGDEDVKVEGESGEFSDLDEDVKVEDEEAGEEEEEEAAGATRTVVKDRLVQPAPWGVLPVIFMLPCVIVMVLVGILGFELVQTTSGLKGPGPLTHEIAKMLGQKVTFK